MKCERCRQLIEANTVHAYLVWPVDNGCTVYSVDLFVAPPEVESDGWITVYPRP